MVERVDDGQGKDPLAGTALGKLLGVDGGATVRANDVTGGGREGQPATLWAALSKLLGIDVGKRVEPEAGERPGREMEGPEDLARKLERMGAPAVARWLRRGGKKGGA